MKRVLAVLLVMVMLLCMLPAASLAATQYGTVVGGWLRLRAAASFNADTITSYYTGTQVTILGTNGGWYYVRTPDGRTGYMYGQYLSLSTGSTTTTGTENAYVTSHNGYGVRLRTGPGTGYRVIRSYAVGTPVTVLQRGTYWSRINIGGTVGYMMSQFLTSGSVSGSGSSTVIGYATIWSRNGYGVRLRTGPGTGYSKIGVYSVGTTVAVLERGAVWDRIRVGSRVGWMMNEFLNYHSTNEVTAVTLNTFTPAVGTVMSVQAITPSQATVTYTWLVDGVAKGSAATYTVTSADVGKTIQLRVTGYGSYTGTTLSPVTNKVVSDTLVTGVKLNTQAPVVGNTLTATITPSDATVVYAWKVGGYQVSNASTYTVTASDATKQIELVVTGTGAFSGTASTLTSAVVPQSTLTGVSVSNTSNTIPGAKPAVGDTLKATVLPELATVSYQWNRGSAAISGANGVNYTLTSADLNATISVTVTGTGNYSGTFTSAPTDAVIAAPTRPIVDDILLHNGKVNETYATQLTATGGGEITWKLTGGNLPAGLTLAENGAITGTPTKAEAATFSVTAANKVGISDAKSFTLTIEEVKLPQAPVITSGHFGNAVVNQPYSRTLTADSASTITWSITGTLPTGLTPNADGVISGTPTVVGTYAFTATATDANGLFASKDFSITVEAAPAPAAPVIVTNFLYNAKVDEAYTAQLEADVAVTWSIAGNPAWLTLDSATGKLSGTPTAAETISFTVTATANGVSSSKTLGLTAEPKPVTPPSANAPIITTNAFGNAKVNEHYSRTLTADKVVVWSSEDKPEWLTLDSATGVISGTPTVAQTYTFTVKATDETSGESAARTFSITVEDAKPAAPVITTKAFGNAKMGEEYGRQLTAESALTLTWTHNDPLPDGLVMDTNGWISGTPTKAGTWSFTVVVKDSADQIATKTFGITVEAVHTAPVIDTNSFGNAKVGEAYYRKLTATAETADVSWSYSGILPTGININTDGEIAGTPTEAGTWNFTVVAMDGNGLMATKQFSITVDAAVQPAAEPIAEPPVPYPAPAPEPEPEPEPEPVHVAPKITTNRFGDATVGQEYYRELTAEAETSVTWSITSGAEPDGIAVQSNGQVSGTPTTAGSWTFTVTALDGNGLTASKQFTITVLNP